MNRVTISNRPNLANNQHVWKMEESSGDEMGETMECEEENIEHDFEQEEEKVYLPGENVDRNEKLVCDESAYILYHQAQTGER